MEMKRKIMAAAFVAAVVGMSGSASADWEQPLYVHMHYAEGQGQVGESEDSCRISGVVNVWQWGYGTNNVVSIHYANCRDGQVVPID